MRVGFDAKRAFLNASGLGNYSRNTLQALRRYFPEHDLTLFTPKVNEQLFSNTDEYDIVSPKTLLSKTFKSFWRSYSVSYQLDKFDIDVFHGFSHELPRGIHKTGVASVVTIHDLIFMRFPQYYKAIDRRIYQQKVTYACKAANKVIAISEQTRDDLVNYLGVHPDKIDVIYQSVSEGYFDRVENPGVQSGYGLSSPYILCVGTIEQRKNQLTVLKALKNLDADLSVVFVGKQSKYAQDLFKYIEEKDLKDRVHFISEVPRQDLANLYKHAFVSVYLSRSEGFGLPVIEAMASECPVITSNVSCLPETAGGAALLCDPDDSKMLATHIESLSETTVRDRFVELGLQRASLFHPEIYAKKLFSLYSKLV